MHAATMTARTAGSGVSRSLHHALWSAMLRPMRLLLASLFTARYRELVAAEGLALDAAPDIVDVPCPRCGALSFADLDPGEEPFELEALEWLAVVRLEAECPDHPVRFVVGP